MSHELKQPEYPVTDDFIERMEQLAGSIFVEDHTDKEGASKARQVRIQIKDSRVKVEKIRKELKADVLEWGKKVDGEARRIRKRLEPLEKHLQEQEDIVRLHEQREKERQEAEAAARVEAERKAEEDRIRKEREKLAAERQRLEAEKARLREEGEHQRRQQEEVDRQRREAEAAKTEAYRVQREAEEAKCRRKKEAEQRARLEASRPDWEKAAGYVDRLASVECPEVEDVECQAFLNRIQRGFIALQGELQQRPVVEVVS